MNHVRNHIRETTDAETRYRARSAGHQICELCERGRRRVTGNVQSTRWQRAVGSGAACLRGVAPASVSVAASDRDEGRPCLLDRPIRTGCMGQLRSMVEIAGTSRPARHGIPTRRRFHPLRCRPRACGPSPVGTPLSLYEPKSAHAKNRRKVMAYRVWRQHLPDEARLTRTKRGRR